MKITVLMGSPRKKDSYSICRLIENHMKEIPHVEFDYIYLTALHIEECRGCDQCFQKSENLCPCKDDLYLVKEKLLQADGIIFVSPVYACQVTGTMKCTIDRLSYLFHRQELVGKPAITVVTTGGGGQKSAGQYLKMTACGWGCHLVGGISIISPMFFKRTGAQPVWGYHESYHTSQSLKIEKTAEAFRTALSAHSLPIPSFYDIYMFQCLRSKTFLSKADYDFWKERGWLSSSYFYDAKLNPPKRLFAGLMKIVIDVAAKKMIGEI